MVAEFTNERKNHIFHCDVLLLWNVFADLNLSILMNKDLTVRWLIEKPTLLEEKNLFSLLRVYEQGMFLSRLHNRQVWSTGIPPLPPSTLPKAQVIPLKLHIVHKVRNINSDLSLVL